MVHHHHHHRYHHNQNHLKRPLKGGTEDDDILEITPIGSGNEVGRSCVLLKYKGKKIMFDCGVHPAYSGLVSLPFFDSVESDIPDIDLLLVSHFHLDHAAAVPYFVGKTKFSGRVFMTHPTKAIYGMLLADFVKVTTITRDDDMLFDEKDLNSSLEKIEKVRYRQKVEHNGIKVTCFNAGHVLGAAMFMVEIAGVKILYTGDFSRQEDRHLMGAETPPVKVDVLIIESTYGVQVHEPRLEREKRFTTSVHDVVSRGGRCLIPVFALGRAQELLLILDEYWIANPSLHGIPIYYASALAKKCMGVYRTYINMMNDRVRAQFDVSNPFEFKYISNIKGIESFDDNGPCVFMASPGMLQSGLSRQLFERWCTSKRNGVVIPGYSVEGTLAKHIMSEPTEITRLDNVSVPLNLSVSYVSFSAHSDFLQTSEFIQEIQPPHVVLVHGDANEMSRLRNALIGRFKSINVLTPKNAQSVSLEFRPEKVAKTLGSVLTSAPQQGDLVQGILVTKDFIHHIVAPNDIHNYTNLKTNTIKQKLTIPFAQNYHILYSTLEQIYDNIEESEERDVNTNSIKPIITIYNEIKLTYNIGVSIVLEWNSNTVNDMICDSIIALVSQIESNPLSIKVRNPLSQSLNDIKEEINTENLKDQEEKLEKRLKDEETPIGDQSDPDNIVNIKVLNKKSRKQSANLDLITQVRSLLEEQYGKMTTDETNPLILIFDLDGQKALIHLESLQVECLDNILKQKLENSIKRIKLSVHPINNIQIINSNNNNETLNNDNNNDNNSHEDNSVEIKN
ncbi:hypothetical protein DICPUDRAFT_158104 [Dictyostelium purpureum]|uniref:Beta-lactamase domain-containing protein n=1 Tax=Dictyostelium purpureum TaxID=5786 RepID=F1A0U8_DICPU|nr:uncharacterized protein DICPUDRAFT_158104 [Dictyostelium purpureum]EGC30185.1 hypothetical protein DICPUDRAFT_158104 [Dictyostelium purpureum]|eukprot:XP_003293292.1 hypothetical protein DICPUDRAFT_158104 [Dictyostelium purpureum]